MTKQNAIEAVYLAVVGGKPSMDATVQRADIENMLAPALSYAMEVNRRQRKGDALREYRFLRTLGSGVQDYFTTITVTASQDTDRDLYYFTLPKKARLTADGDGIGQLYPKEGIGSYVRVPSLNALRGINMPNVVFYWLENVSQEQRIYALNLGLPACDHLMKIVVSYDDLEDTDDLLVPDEIAFTAIQLLTEFFMGQKNGLVEKRANDNKDG